MIVDDEHLHFEAFAETLRRHGHALTREEYVVEYLGLDDRDFFASAVLDRTGEDLAPPEIQRLVEEKADVYAGKTDGCVPFFPGMKPLIADLADVVPLGLYSGARRAEVLSILDREGLMGCFGAIVSADDVERGKPDPEGYLLACRRIRAGVAGFSDLQPSECLVIEDAPTGVAAARAAGMRCLALAHTRPVEELDGADRVAETLEGKSAEWLLELCGALADRGMDER